MASTKKSKFSLDSLTTIMSGVAAEEKLPDIRNIELNQIYVGQQPRQIMGLVENFGQDPSEEDWVIPVSDFLNHLRTTANENSKSVAATSLNELKQMAQSISQHGVLQPILVRYQEGEERYIVTDGHRRALAALIAGETSIDAKIKREWTQDEVLSEQLIANLQRKDLTALELARAIAQLRELYSKQIRETEPKLHPNQLIARVWDKLEASLGLGRRQLQRLMQLNEIADKIDADILNMASDLKERQIRPFFRLPKEDQAQGLIIAALNKGRSYQDFEKLVERCLRGEDLVSAGLDLELNLPQDIKPNWDPILSPTRGRPDAPTPFISDSPVTENDTDEQDAYRVRNVLMALKRMPGNPEPLLRRLEEELASSGERERIKRLRRIEEIEQEALKLSRRLAEIRKKFGQG